MENHKLQAQLKATPEKPWYGYRVLGCIQNSLITSLVLSLTFIFSGSIFANDSVNKISKYAATLADSITVSRVEYDGATVTFKAISNGCTQTDHFKARHEIHEGQCRLEIYRTKQDYCRAAPMPVSVSIAWPLPESCDHGNLLLTNRLLLQHSKTLNPQNSLTTKQEPQQQSQENSGKLKKQ